jgi:hypothetical protein
MERVEAQALATVAAVAAAETVAPLTATCEKRFRVWTEAF